MKADFKKWLREGRKSGYYPVHPSHYDEVNEFAEDFAKQEAIGFDNYIRDYYYPDETIDEGMRDSDYENYKREKNGN